MATISGARVIDEAAAADGLPARATTPGPEVMDRGMLPLRPFGALDHVDGVLTLSFAEAIRGAHREVVIDGRPGDRAVRVVVPPGVYDGQVLCVNGDAGAGGEAGPPGDDAGSRMPGVPGPDDRYLLVHIEPDPRFRRDGRDLHTEIPLTLAQAAFGAVLEVDTVDGPLTVRVPPGSESGHHLRFRGRGVAAGDGVPAGHLYVGLRIVLPDLDPEDEAVRAAIALIESKYPR